MCLHPPPLWPDNSQPFFPSLQLDSAPVPGTFSIASIIASLTGGDLEAIMNKVGANDPVSWSLVLEDYGMKLAYCPTDIRRVIHYLDELVALNDVFILTYYTPERPPRILAEPDNLGWICGMHSVLVVREMVYDPYLDIRQRIYAHHCRHFHTKSIFRVVPVVVTTQN